MVNLTDKQLEALKLGRRKGLTKKRPSGLKYKIRQVNKGWFKEGDTPINPFPKGSVPWNKNKKGLTKRNKTSFKKGNVPWNKGKTFEAILWDKHPNFTTGRRRIRQHLARNGFKPICNRCGKKSKFGRKIHVHHKDRNPDNNELINVEILCAKCHAHEHKNWNKRSFVQT